MKTLKQKIIDQNIVSLLMHKRMAFFKLHFFELVNEIINATSFLDEKKNVSFNERVYCILNDITSIKKCCVCNTQNVTFKGINKGYNDCCSVKCAAKNPKRNEHIQQTNIIRYGCKCSLQSKESENKKKETWMRNYGVDHPSKSLKVKKQKQQTFQKKYGVDSPGQIEEGKIKARQTCLNLYGYEYASQSPDFQKRVQTTMINNYGVPYYLCKTDLNRGKSNKIKSYDAMLENMYDEPQFSLDEYLARKNDKELLKFKCKTCNTIFDATHCNGFHNRCPACYPPTKLGYSIEEKKLLEFISSIYQNQIIENDRTLISPYELDIVIPNKNLAIEFDGLYWHSHQVLQNKQYHLNKTNLCSSIGIQLIHIFENEWVIKQNIVKNRLKNLLGIYDKTIFARKCIVQPVNNQISSSFLDQNHLQGATYSKINLGLFYENNLIAIMTFSKPRYNSKIQWELVRFCSKLGYHIPGGASKLLKYFECTYQPKSLLSYADRRWSTGNLYKSLGFTLDHLSAPNYWYFENCSLILESRLKYQKHKQKNLLAKFDDTKTEIQNMIDNNYHVIYDCGNLVYVKFY